MNAVSGVVRVVGDTNGTSVALQILPVITDVQVQSVAADGSSAEVVLRGFGFVEGNASEYRFGTSRGARCGHGHRPGCSGSVQPGAGRYDSNGQVVLSVPLNNGSFGAISVKTAGGASAAYSVSLSSITATALSGTPADANEASAIPGQAITLNGTGLSTATDVLLRYVDIDGSAADGAAQPHRRGGRRHQRHADRARATANGAFELQVLGSASQPLLQIVPVLKSFDENGSLNLYGAGFVEGDSNLVLAGVSMTTRWSTPGRHHVLLRQHARCSTSTTAAATFTAATLPRYGLGNVTVTTAGGTSAALALNVMRPGSDSASVGALGDVAVNAAGNLWVSDTANPSRLLRIDAGQRQRAADHDAEPPTSARPTCSTRRAADRPCGRPTPWCRYSS